MMHTDPILIPMEDEVIHTPEHPFCADPFCPCHEDNMLIGEIAAQVEDGTLTPKQATDIVSGKRR